MLTMGSLFDGSGGFPLGAALNGIKPVWASEIEPYPMRVTAARLPDMVQLGDVTKIDGAAIEPVDIITFGSPCQDLSVAGKQAGIHEGARSSLFFEAIRIIKEMRSRVDRKADEPVRPRWAVWENVPGAFSSHGGDDFRAVLQTLASVARCQVPIPGPAGGKWKPAGAIVGDGWSIAWRVFDAQYWGVPQRRKRIYLVADFGGERAGEVLFERQSVSGHSAAGGEAGQAPAAHAERSARGSGGIRCLNPNDSQTERIYDANGTMPCLSANSSGGQNRMGICYAPMNNHCAGYEEAETAATMQTSYHTGSGGDAALVCYDCRGNGNGQTVPTLTGDHQNRVTDYTSVVCRRTHYSEFAQDNVKQPVIYPGAQITSPICRSNPKPGDPAPTITVSSGNDYVVGTLDASYYKGQGARNGAEREYIIEKSNAPTRKYIVRRLTPLECCRLQGFPDWWEDGVEGSDSARYKMWGNGVALPCVERVMYGIRKVEGQ